MATSTSGSVRVTSRACGCPTAKLDALIAYLNGLSGRADLRVLDDLLKRASVTRDDLESILSFGEKGYKRNCITRSEWYELVAICWKNGQRSPIHDHRGSSCAFRVVHGTGLETRFRFEEKVLRVAASNRMPEGYVCAAEDEDIHEIANAEPTGRDLVTLHIYSPPLKRMNTYELESGEVREASECCGGGACVGEGE